MNERQVELARHALGLPNKNRRSYRRHFVAGPGHTDYDDWEQMVAAGDARKWEGGQLTGGDPCFLLTACGAAKALKRGETLSEEDFPTVRL